MVAQISDGLPFTNLLCLHHHMGEVIITEVHFSVMITLCLLGVEIGTVGSVGMHENAFCFRGAVFGHRSKL